MILSLRVLDGHAEEFQNGFTLALQTAHLISHCLPIVSILSYGSEKLVLLILREVALRPCFGSLFKLWGEVFGQALPLGVFDFPQGEVDF